MFLVQYQIGNRGGTGGTSGVDYLKKTIRSIAIHSCMRISITVAAVYVCR